MKQFLQNTGRSSSLAALFIGVVTLLLSSVAPSNAMIRCDGRFQYIKGHGWHATNYCENNYLAAMARDRGWKVSNLSVRENPLLKARICRHIGQDGRLIGICFGGGSDVPEQGYDNCVR